MKLVNIRCAATRIRCSAATLVALAMLFGQAMPLAAASAVELLRDPWGTPHVFAVSEVDGFFALGYAAAEDRLLEMKLIRRKAAGRLAEVFGPDWVDADREARIAGHAPYAPRAFAKRPARGQEVLRACAAGKPILESDLQLPLSSPPLTCLDTGTIWSQPGNLYSQIVDLSHLDNSRSMIAPGNAEDGPFRTNQVDLWVRGTMHPAPLSRAKVEALGVTRTRLAAKPYKGPPTHTPGTLSHQMEDGRGGGPRFIPAIPPVTTAAHAEAKPLPGRKPDDPRLEAAFRVILRQGTPNEEVDAQLADCRAYVKGNTGLTEQLRNAALLGEHLIEESAAGRLKVRYGSPHVLEKLRTLLNDLGGRGRPVSGDHPPGAPAEVWLCAGDRIMELLQPGAEWPSVKQHLRGIKLYIGQLSANQRRSREQTIGQLRPLAKFLRENNLQVAVELGGCLDFSPMDDTAGEWSAQHELAALANFYAAGGEVDYLDLDGPIRRLLHPENRRDGRRFGSTDKAADELVDALKLHRAAHPQTQYWLLTNFPNWGWRGGVSYHARGPQRQDYGDYDQVVKIVLEKLRAAGIPLDGVTVDNPYDYLVGEHFSVKLADPKSVDWLARVRSYEDFAREQGLTFNLIVNSQRGGQESDERFFRETLRMVDAYWRAGGRPTRWFVQSWYPYPKQMLPETAQPSMTALVKAVIERVRGGTSERAAPAGSARGGLAEPTGAVLPVRVIENVSHGRAAPSPDQSSARARDSRAARRPGASPAGRITLQPVQGKMVAAALVPHLGGQSFALGIPETIGARMGMILNFPEVEGKLAWTGPGEDGALTSQWTKEGVVHYHVRLVPGDDFVDIEMTVRNLSADTWHDVFAFNCLNPTGARAFQDWKLQRTYLSRGGKPFRMSETTRVQGHMPTVGFYLPEHVRAGEESVFVRGFGATSPDRTDGSWIVTLSEPAGSYMAATAMEAAFLFDNLDRCCLHAAPSFGDIGPGEASTTVSRFYLAKGTLEDFRRRMEEDRPTLAARQQWARPVAGARTEKPHGRLEEMSPDEACNTEAGLC